MEKFNPMVFLGKLFDNKRFLIAFSIICALVFWLIIDIAENPTRDVILSDIPITVSDRDDDNGNTLSVIGEYNDKVTVTVSGPGYIVGNASSDDVTVSVSSYADVTKPGTYVLVLTATTSRSGCTVSKISPSYVQVVYDYDTSAEIPVEVDAGILQPYIESDCEIYKSSLKNNADGAEITALAVSGPSETLSSIAKVVVKPVLDGSNAAGLTQNYKTELTFYDMMDNPVDSSQLVYNTDTYLRVIVYKTAEVKLVPSFTNMPSYYASLPTGMPPHTVSIYNDMARSTEKVSSVSVKGPVDTVNELIASGLKLAPIDFAEVRPGKTSFNVSFVLADGVEIVDGVEEVTVSLDLGYITTKTIYVQPSSITYKNLKAGLTAGTSYKKSIAVVICGKSAVLKKINADNISVWADCADVSSAGTETKKLNVTLPSELEAWVNSCEPSEISVLVK